MKTIVDIPDVIFQAITSRAAQRGQDFDATLTEILSRGIEAGTFEKNLPQPELEKPQLQRDPDTGLLVIGNGRRPIAGQELTSDQLAEILHNQEVEWHHEASRH